MWGLNIVEGGLDGKGNNVVLEVVFVLYSDFDCKECNCVIIRSIAMNCVDMNREY